MRLTRSSGVAILALSMLGEPTAAGTIDDGDGCALDVESRVAADRAVQRVYHAHRLAAATPFETALPWGSSEERVLRCLKLTAALREFWNVEVTDRMLAAEVRRMRTSTKDPSRLHEIESALGNDAVLFGEIVARPLLTERIARNLFQHDPVIHAIARGHAERLAARLRSNAAAPPQSADDWRRFEVYRSREPSRFEDVSASLPPRPGSVSSVRESRSTFAVDVLLAREADRIEFVRYFVPKRTWESWWTAVSDALSASCSSIAGPETARAASDSVADLHCRPDDSWADGTLDGLRERSSHTMVWTGSEMLVWGGATFDVVNQVLVGQGLRYDPVTDTWSPMSADGAPGGRIRHSAVWTGREMIVWGGARTGGGALADGARYDPGLDRWTPMSTTGAPTGRTRHVAVWTGQRMLVWGGASGTGIDLGDGGSYDPASDRWSPISTIAAPAGRAQATGIWTGAEMIVWGGQSSIVDDVPFGTGGRYDPVLDKWTAITTTGSPAPRWAHSAVWTGSEMIVWGGSSRSSLSPAFGDGARYDPTQNSWSAVGTTGAPVGQAGHAAHWSGEYMIVWGGLGASGFMEDGGRYRPATDEWVGMATTSQPTFTWRRPSIWTGTEMIVWGGGEQTQPEVNEGARYDPQKDLWRPTSTVGPQAVTKHEAVWTGSEMLVWGGWGDYDTKNFPPQGVRFDPALDAWTPMTEQGAPEGRELHTAVWTGSRMVVWGGVNLVGGTQNVFGNGAQYDPGADAWTPVSLLNAPTPRRNHSAVWTGTRMLVWGGSNDADAAVADGRSYDPVSDQWAPITLTNGPAARQLHTATWTGSAMIVWGGIGSGGGLLRSGGRYDPAIDQWSSMTTNGAPTGRYSHTSVWTGSRLVVWGGLDALGSGVDSGGRYNPSTNAWSATTLTNAPLGRHAHTAVWTGTEMIVWGGEIQEYSTGSEHLSGGRYTPSSDSWRATSTTNAPAARADHVAVWTGELMLVWSGDSHPHASGGTYVVGPPDADDDGVADACDCAVNDPSSTAVPTEAASLRIAVDKTALTWYASTGGSGTVHDVVRGTLATFPVGSGGESCLASGVTESRLDDPATPASGGYWYLVRGRNACGPGTYGEATGGTRTTATCP